MIASVICMILMSLFFFSPVEVNNATLEMDTSLLEGDTDYVWQLTVLTVHNKSHSVTFTNRKTSGDEPKFEIVTKGIKGDKPVKINKR